MQWLFRTSNLFGHKLISKINSVFNISENMCPNVSAEFRSSLYIFVFSFKNFLYLTKKEISQFHSMYMGRIQFPVILFSILFNYYQIMLKLANNVKQVNRFQQILATLRQKFFYSKDAILAILLQNFYK